MKYLSILLLSIVSCTSQITDSRLTRAEHVVYHNPHQAIIILSPYNIDSFTTQHDKALYALLYTQSMHNHGLTTSSDSLIAFAQQYYKQNNDKARYAAACLHHGVFYQNISHLDQAVRELKQAEELSDGNNIDLNYQINTYLGDINEQTSNWQLAANYYHKSIKYAFISKDTTWMINSINKTAMLYLKQAQPDSAMQCLHKTLPLLDGGSKEAKATALAYIGRAYFQKKDYTTALEYLNRSQAIYPTDDCILTLTNIYNRNGQINKAIDNWYALLSSSNTDVIINAYKNLIAYFGSIKNYTIAYDLSSRLNAEYENKDVKNDTENINNIQKQYDNQIKKRQRYTLLTILLTIITLLLCTLLGYFFYSRRKEKKYSNMIADINERYNNDLYEYRQAQQQLLLMQTRNQQNAYEIKAKEQLIEKLQNKLADYQEDKEQPAEWNIESNLLNDNIVIHLHHLATTGRTPADSDWQLLTDTLTRYAPKYMQVITDCPMLNPKEIHTAHLIRLRFIPSEISVLTATSAQTVTNIRGRLLQKIFHVKGGARDFDHRIRIL